MTDKVMDGDEILTSSTAFDNLIWREGILEVYPSAEILMAGEFIFFPTESNDPVGKIYRALRSRIALESGRGKTFESFHIYNEYNPQKSFFFPCLIIHNDEPSETSSSFFGGELMESVPIIIEVAFKRDRAKITSDGTLSGKGLAEYYLFQTRNLMDEILYEGDSVQVGSVEYNTTLHEPTEPNQSLYGFSLQAKLDFKTGGSYVGD